MKCNLRIQCFLPALLLITIGVWIYLDGIDYKDTTTDSIATFLKIYSVLFIFGVAWDVRYKLNEIKIMKAGTKALILIIAIVFLISPVDAQWADPTLQYRTSTPIANGVRLYQPSLNLSNAVGTNNATWIFCNAHCNTNYTDIRFYLDNATLLSYWLEDNSSTAGKVWVNVTANGTVNMYYGKASSSSYSNGTTTFLQFQDYTGTDFKLSNVAGSGQNISIRIKHNLNTAHNDDFIGASNSVSFSTDDSTYFGLPGTLAGALATTYNAAVFTQTNTGAFTDIDNIWDISVYGANVDFYKNNAYLTSINTNVPNSDMGLKFQQTIAGGGTGSIWYWGFIRNYVLPQPQWATWTAQEAFLISSWGNNFTNDDTLNFTISANTYINFNVTNTSRLDNFAWYLNGVNQSVNYNNISLSISSAGINNVTVFAFNNTNVTSISWFVTLPFTLLTPANGSIINGTYPPRDQEIFFSWNSVGYPYYELIVSRSPDFSLIVSDTYVTTTYKNISLPTGSYWWKVRNYDSGTGLWGNYSSTFNFTLALSSTATGKGIDGVVYEIISGNYQPIDQATVYIYNNTYSSLQITGTNGYYLFTNLANGTYNIYAVKNGYDTTAVFPVSVNGSITTNDILMKIYISPYVPNFVFERFIVRDLFDRSYTGVTVSVYKGDSPIVSLSGTTDSTGSAVFQLIKDQRYRVTFTGGGISGTITVYVYAKEENYFVRVLTGFPTGGDRYTDIQTNLTSIAINSTWSDLTLIYNDTKNSTSLVQFYATNLTTGITCYKNSTSNVVTLQCPVLASGSYQFGFNATSSIYGFFQQDQIINFDVGKPSTPSVNPNVDSDLMQWASIILIVLTAALFSIRTVKYGAVIVPLEALALWAFGWFEPIVNNQAGSFLLLSCAVVIGIMIYLRGSEVKVNF